MIPQRLAGKRVAVTGSTGFLGTALVERLLRGVPDLHLVLLIRPGRRTSPDARAKREIFRNDAFDRLRESLGRDGFDAMLDERVTIIAGDVGTDGLGLDDDGRAALANCDIVIHSAATVAFDSPLDGAVEVNLLGPSRIAQTLHDLNVSPHLVAVSTCYVAGNRRGSAPEEHVADSPYFIDVDWRREVDAARRARADAEAESRNPEMLRRFRKEAERELGAAGTPLLAAKTEQRRTRWVSDRMVDAGRSRAASLGWPDAYAYTKALGERALMETKGDLDVSIVRPSIIESAWAEPRPGWIRGFRMAEPIIVSYARGLLKQFPGIPEGIVDVIPVDLVVAAICAVAARGPQGDHDIVQVASGSRNPLRYRRLVDLVRSWFTDHPLYDADGQPIIVPEWSFPGRGKVQQQLTRATTNLQRVESALLKLPLRGKQAAFAAGLEEKRELAERALGYVELYGAYAECEAVYGVARLLELAEEVQGSAADGDSMDLDPMVVDWDHYVHGIHLPSVVHHARVRTSADGRRPENRTQRLRRQVLAPERSFAAFDLENTLIASNVVTSYAWLASRRLPREEVLRLTLKTFLEGPSLLALDRRDRTDFLRHFYRRYANAPVEQLEEDVQEMFSQLVLSKAFPAGLRRVRAHRAAGHRTVLITGALDFVVAPLAPLFDDIIAAEMSVNGEGAYTGELTVVPPTGEAREQALIDYAAEHDLDVKEAVAYADSSSDLPMLEAVGFPVAVNPETRLLGIARKRGWLIEPWQKTAGAPDRLLPLAPNSRFRRSA
ncbi:MAG: HAD-IB family hydrolase [Actinomycetia bacterium]|nr:HAD-IB family hydrolase [Actinomycetes bacterium]MCP3912673.1 HAD-IB family hydrolase [Actinomycetes bacterium]